MAKGAAGGSGGGSRLRRRYSGDAAAADDGRWTIFPLQLDAAAAAAPPEAPLSGETLARGPKAPLAEGLCPAPLEPPPEAPLGTLLPEGMGLPHGNGCGGHGSAVLVAAGLACRAQRCRSRRTHIRGLRLHSAYIYIPRKSSAHISLSPPAASVKLPPAVVPHHAPPPNKPSLARQAAPSPSPPRSKLTCRASTSGASSSQSPALAGPEVMMPGNCTGGRQQRGEDSRGQGADKRGQGGLHRG